MCYCTMQDATRDPGHVKSISVSLALCHSLPSECRRCLVRVRSWMERYQQLAVAAAVALFLRTSRRHACAWFWPANPPVHLFLVDGRSVGFVKIDSSHPFSASERWSRRLDQPMLLYIVGQDPSRKGLVASQARNFPTTGHVLDACQ